MATLLATIDTAPLLDLVDRKGSFVYVEQIVEWHRVGHIELFASSRLLNPDTWKMNPKQKADLRRLLAEHGITIASSSFRLGISPLGGSDVLGGTEGGRSPEEMKRFEKIVGPDPASLPPDSVGRGMQRKIGDYDALPDHFASKRDVFVTLDKHDYFHTNRRPRYERELGLMIRSPQELVHCYSRDHGAK